MADDDPDREVPTPKTTGSFAVFHEECLRISSRFATIAAVKERTLQALDIRGAKQARGYSDELARMAARFAEWPTLTREEVEFERQRSVGRLMDLNRICEETAAAMKLPK